MVLKPDLVTHLSILKPIYHEWNDNLRKLMCIANLYFSWKSGVLWLLGIFCWLSSLQLELNFLILLRLNPRTHMCTLWFPITSLLTSSSCVCSCLSIIKKQMGKDHYIMVKLMWLFLWTVLIEEVFIIQLDAKEDKWESCFINCILAK